MKRIVILGAGESGAGAAVLAKVKGFETFVSDMSAIKDKYKELLDSHQIAWEEGHHTEELILNADEVIKSPGIPNDAPIILKLKAQGTPVISEIEFAGRYTDAKMICITGSNGKTTTTSLIYHIFKSAGLNVGLAKQYGFWITKNYRESYGMFAVNGILFNHESERRGETFVTRKISLAAARIAQGEQDKLYLGNLDARRDWGYAKDYVECMWLILQHDVPEDFVIATGEMHTVREFATLAFKEAGIELRWEGEGVDEKGIDVATGKVLVEVDPKYFRPAEVEQLLGDPTKARTLLGWNPRKTSFGELVSIMVRHDMEKVKRMIATKH